MRFLHTSDLHLGKRLHEVSLLADQEYILRQITALAEEKGCDAVVIAGDIYDKSAPSAEAVALFDRFATELCGKGIALIANYGNHDSADRVGYASALLHQSGVHLSPRFHGTVERAVLRDDFGDVNFYLLPFLKPVTVSAACDCGEFDSYDGAVRYAVGLTEADLCARNVIVSHQYVTGGERSESEEVNVGGLDNISADIFDGFDYCALGHLHKPQKILRETVRYAGSPLKYSLDEYGSPKSAVLVTMGEKGVCETELLPLVPLHDVRRLKGSYDELTLRSNYEGTAVDDYLHVILTDEDYVTDALYKLRTIYPNIMKLEYANARTAHHADMDELSAAAAEGDDLTPLEMFAALYRGQNNTELTESGAAFAAGVFDKLTEVDK